MLCIGVGLMVVVLLVYLVVVIWFVVMFILVGIFVFIGMGIMFLVLVLIGVWVFVCEMMFGFGVDCFGCIFDVEGGMLLVEMELMLSGCIVWVDVDLLIVWYVFVVDVVVDDWCVWYCFGVVQDVVGCWKDVRVSIWEVICFFWC